MLQAAAFTLAFTLVSGATHALVARWLLRQFPSLRSPPARRRRFVRVVAALVLVTPIARWFEIWLESPLMARLQAFGMVEVSVVAISAIPLGLVAVVFHLLRFARAITVRAGHHEGIAGPAPDPESPVDAPKLTRREAVERIGGLTVFGATSAAIGWGMVRGRHEFSVEEVVVRIPGLPRALDGYTITQVSDIHTGMFVGARELAEGLSRVAETKPDLVVATGDLVDYDGRYVGLMARALADLKSGRLARDGVYAILGNHDYYTGARAVRAGLRAVGVRVLVNEGLVVRADDGGGFALLGVADLFARHRGEEGPSLETAIAAVPPDAPRILLAHQPRYFDDAAGKVALQLSGHTHGGQINPGFRPADLVMEYVAGRYERAGSSLYVNRGFGVAGPPSRVGAPPEVTKIVLVAG